MSDFFKTVYSGGMGEIEEKKSRFIAHVAPVTTADEASEFIAGIKKKYWDARHNCSAYVIGQSQEVSRSSDDGEPSGTAGKPILEVINGLDLTDVCIVVTRYFGGVLLGTGGLIRAYTAAAKAGLENSVIIEKLNGTRINIDLDYTLEGKVRTFLREREVPLLDCVYSDKVRLIAAVKDSMVEGFKASVTDATDGRAGVSEDGKLVYAEAEGKVILF